MANRNEIKNDTSDRELIITRLLNAPRELVWDVFTKPEHIKNWWAQTVLRIPLIRWT